MTEVIKKNITNFETSDQGDNENVNPDTEVGDVITCDNVNKDSINKLVKDCDKNCEQKEQKISQLGDGQQNEGDKR